MIEPIAIIGMGCRYPQAAGMDALWQLLAEGEDAIRPYQGGRFRELDEAYAQTAEGSGRLATNLGGFLEGVDRFDASFFGISPREEEFIDPQQGMFLKLSWNALEDAGLESLRIKRTIRSGATQQVTSVTRWFGQSRLQVLEEAMQEEAARAMGFRQQKLPSLEARLADLEMNSLMAVKQRNRRQTIAGHSLPATFAFDYPTCSEMALAQDMLLWSAGLEADQDLNLERDEMQI